MSTTSAQIEDASLKSIEMLTLRISKGVQIEKTLLSIDYFIEKCIQCCLVYLKDADLKLVWPSAKCLLAISNSNEIAFILVAKVLIRFLLEQYAQQSNHINQKKIYLELLVKFLLNGQKYSKINECKYLIESKNEILNFCFDILNSSDLKKGLEAQALMLIGILVKHKNIINADDSYQLIKQLWDQDFDLSDNKTEAINIILEIISNHESLFEHVFNSVDRKPKLYQMKILNLFSKFNFESSKLNTKLEAIVRTATFNPDSEDSIIQLVEIYRNLIEFNQKYENNVENKENFNKNTLNYLNFLTNEVKLVENLDLILKTSYLFQIFASKLESKIVFKSLFDILIVKINDLKSFEVCELTVIKISIIDFSFFSSSIVQLMQF